MKQRTKVGSNWTFGSQSRHQKVCRMQPRQSSVLPTWIPCRACRLEPLVWKSQTAYSRTVIRCKREQQSSYRVPTIIVLSIPR